MLVSRSFQRLLVALALVLFITGMLAYHNSLLRLVRDSQLKSSLPSFKDATTLPHGERVDIRDAEPVYASFLSPKNSTLGFEAIRYINLDYRWDRDDSIRLQAALTEISPKKFSAVKSTDIRDKGISPISNDVAIQPTQLACFRSHANLWSEMIENNWSTMLVLEADAAWDLAVKSIMSRMSAALNALLQSTNATENDPYSHEQWDMISLGHCFDGPSNMNDNVIYSDPDVQENQAFFGKTLENERVIRRSGGPACTTAYAVSQSGARKLLARSALDMNKPIDLIISDLVSSGQVTAFSTHPVVFTQLAFRDGLGLSEKNSDVDQREAEENGLYSDEYRQNWEQAYKDRSVWATAEIYRHSTLKHPAFDYIGKTFFKDASPDIDTELWWPDKAGENSGVVIVEATVMAPEDETEDKAAVKTKVHSEETSDKPDTTKSTHKGLETKPSTTA